MTYFFIISKLPVLARERDTVLLFVCLTVFQLSEGSSPKAFSENADTADHAEKVKIRIRKLQIRIHRSADSIHFFLPVTESY